MEGRRVEGIFLETSILRSRAQEAYEAAKVYEIRIRSIVPEALLFSLGGQGARLKAVVKQVNPRRILLLLENGYELSADNKLALPVEEGEELILRVESKNPLILRVEGSFKGLQNAEKLLHNIKENPATIVKIKEFKKGIEDSGLFYEKKVWNVLKGVLKESDLLSDQKFKLLKSLTNFEPFKVEKLLKSLKEFPDLSRKAEELLSLMNKEDKINFFLKFISFQKEVERAIYQRENKFTEIRKNTEEIIKLFIKSFKGKMDTLGLKAVLKENYYSPRVLDIMEKAIKSLETNKWNEFQSRLKLLGFRIENNEILPLIRGNLLKYAKDILKGAFASLEAKTGFNSVRDLIQYQKKVEEEIEALKNLKKEFSDIPYDLKENLQKLNWINQLQNYMILSEGKKFLLPFVTEEGKGIAGFSLKDSFRILVKLTWEEGYVGICLEAPRKEKPDFINLVFRSNIKLLADIVRKEEKRLRKELSELNLKILKFEVLEEGEQSFEREFFSEFGEERIFNLRV